ncbi:MAG: LysM peptidoglycan-binding domain-containing protein [Lachnospirales bacterium]
MKKLITLTLALSLATASTVLADTTYVVEKNDTLWKIANSYNTTYQQLAKYNKIENPDLIYVGDEILIPEKQTKPIEVPDVEVPETEVPVVEVPETEVPETEVPVVTLPIVLPSEEVEVVSVTANTTVENDGLYVNSYTYLLSEDYTSELSKDSFKIEYTVAPNAYLGETEPSVKEAEITNVTVNGSEVLIEVVPAIYTSLTNVTITSANESFNSVKENFEVSKELVDLFEHNTFTSSEGVELSYFLYLPEETTENLPLMVWEHGGGEVLAASFEGANLSANKGAVTWIENDIETAILSVQYPANYSFSITSVEEEYAQMQAFNDAKYELIQELITAGTVNKDRVYITGISSGGGGALRFVMQYPDLFASGLIIAAKDTVAPISTPYNLAYQLTDPSLLKLSEEDYNTVYGLMETELANYDFTEVPLWFVHAENDPVCTYYTTTMTYEILEKMGAKENKLTVYTDEEMQAAGQFFYHSSWVPALVDEEIIDWLYSQSK